MGILIKADKKSINKDRNIDHQIGKKTFLYDIILTNSNVSIEYHCFLCFFAFLFFPISLSNLPKLCN